MLGGSSHSTGASPPTTEGTTPLPACLQCTNDIPPATRKGGKPRTYCSPPCQIKAANSRRATTRSGRVSVASRTPKPGSDSPIDLPILSTPPEATTPPLRATVAKLFGSYYVRVNGQLALGPMDQLRAHDHADRINARSADKGAVQATAGVGK
jgi:hypothetical protein